MVKRSLVLSLVLGVAGCAGVEPTEDVAGAVDALGTRVHNSVMNGSGASLYAWSPTGGAYVEVWETSRTGANIYFYAEQLDPSSEVCETYTYWECSPPPGCDPGLPCCFPGEPGCCSLEECCTPYETTYCYYTRSAYEVGYGTLPRGAFQTNGQAARLRANVAPGPSMTLYRCTSDWSIGVSECGDGVGGAIDLTWRPDGGSSSSRRGTEEYGYDRWTLRVNGTLRYSSASAVGSVLSQPVTGSGGVSRGNTVRHEIFRAR